VQLEGVLAKAEQLRQEGRHEEAIAVLEPVTKASDSRLEEFASRAAERTREYRAEWKGYQAKAEEAVEEAERCVADRQYEAAVRVLKRVPPALRSEQMFVLLEEAQARLREIASLEDELSSAIACRGTLSLLPKVSRLLTLQPNHTRAQELAERFRERVCRAAEEKIGNRQYRAARDLVATLPEIVRDQEVEALSQRAAELAWLSDDLRNAPYVDPTLVQVARRLHTLSKNDQRVGRLLAEVRRRERIGSADPRRAYPPWASAAEENRLGYPVEWLNGFGRIHIHENMAGRVLVDHPGRLYVACGLAIQGLERAAIQLNLLPKGSQTRLSRIADMLNEDPMAWVNRKRLPRSAWGLDLSTSGLKAVKLVAHGERGEVVLEQVDVIPHRKVLSEALSDDEAQSLIENTIKQFRERNDVKADRICLGLMGRMVLSQRFTMPSLAPEKREKAIAYEARRRIPVPLDEAAWGYEVTAPRKGEQSAREEEILLVAARKPQLLRHLSALRSQNVRIDVIQSDFVALHNYLVYDRLGPEPPEDDASAEPRDPVALLDVGSDQTHLVVSSPTSLWHRSSRFGGEQFTRAIVREFQVTVAQAEELKRSPARAESLSRLYAALEPALATLADESRSLIQSFTSHTRAGAIRRLCGCGGSFQLHGLLRFLREAP
jgi:type IV pilus assembly protein PilM